MKNSYSNFSWVFLDGSGCLVSLSSRKRARDSKKRNRSFGSSLNLKRGRHRLDRMFCMHLSSY
jgi:hypothetical protein